MHLLEARGLVKRFGGVAAVGDVSFSVPPAQWLGIIGPNGAGKSTLFNLLGGQLLPSRGSISFAGTDITRMTPHSVSISASGDRSRSPASFEGSAWSIT